MIDAHLLASGLCQLPGGRQIGLGFFADLIETDGAGAAPLPIRRLIVTVPSAPHAPRDELSATPRRGEVPTRSGSVGNLLER